MTVHKVNAENRILGRLASEIALLLRGKNRIDFYPHINRGETVEVSNVAKIALSGRKRTQKTYHRYSGYPGGLKTTKLMEKNPSQVLRRAVYGMLPKNKLRDKMIKRLVIQ